MIRRWSLLFLVAASALAHGQTATPYRPTGIYRAGEAAGWEVAGTGKVFFRLRSNNQVLLRAGTLDLSTGPARVEAKLREPAMLHLELTPEGGKPKLYGAVIDPLKIRPAAERPRDFDAFWRRKLSELRQIPMNPLVKPTAADRPGVDYATIQLDHVNGTKVHGQIAKPQRQGKYPAVLVLQWASPPYRLWAPWVTERAAQGFIVLNVQPHDVLPTEPQEYYDALPKDIKDYSSIRQDDRERNYFVEMYLRGVRAVDYLTRDPNWDGKTIIVTGTSMGGQQSFAVAGLHPRVTHMIVHVPAGADTNAPLHGRQQGYPWFDLKDPKKAEVARYVDTINFSPQIRAKSLVSMGFVDTVTPPAGIWTAFNLIRGPKEAVPLVDAPHNNLATPEQQQAFFERSNAWWEALAKGQSVPVKKPIK